MLKKNLADVKKKISRAAERAGKREDEIRLVAVTKEAELAQVREIVNLGIKDLGENRLQDTLPKFAVLGNEVSWHMIGHLQTNKVKKAVKIFDFIHSLDSLRLARKISEECAGLGKTMPVLLQVNVSAETSKFGVRPRDAEILIREMAPLSHIRVCGLMTMAPWGADPEESRPYFCALKELSEEIALKEIAGVKMEYLSMGMSQDFEVAIEEGANIVRVGSAIFRREKR